MKMKCILALLLLMGCAGSAEKKTNEMAQLHPFVLSENIPFSNKLNYLATEGAIERGNAEALANIYEEFRRREFDIMFNYQDSFVILWQRGLYANENMDAIFNHLKSNDITMYYLTYVQVRDKKRLIQKYLNGRSYHIHARKMANREFWTSELYFGHVGDRMTNEQMDNHFETELWYENNKDQIHEEHGSGPLYLCNKKAFKSLEELRKKYPNLLYLKVKDPPYRVR